jgi:signal peptidase II
MKLSRNRTIALGIVLVVAADWLSKFWVQDRIRLHDVHTVVDQWLWLNHRRNPGIAFSFFNDLPAGVRIPFLAGAALLGIFVAGRILLGARDASLRVAAGLVIAGALGNLGDRLWNGAVTDFIQLRYFPFIFNVADVAITVGAVVLLARLTLAQEPAEGAPAPTPS